MVDTGRPVVLMPMKCRLCDKPFARPKAFDLSQPGAAETAVARMMTQHLHERHKNEAMAAQLLGQEYAGMLTLRYFQMDDELMRLADRVRWKIHTATGATSVSRERIIEKTRSAFGRFMTIEQIDECMQPGGLGAMVVSLIESMRDALLERDKYPDLAAAAAQSALTHPH